MKKAITLMLLALCMALALPGCSGGFAATLTDKQIDELFAQRLNPPEPPPDEKPDEAICTTMRIAGCSASAI